MDKVREWLKKEMSLKGLDWNSDRAWLDADKTMQEMIDRLPNATFDGLRHFQLLADGVNVFKTAFVCNVGLKLFDNDPNYNSLTSMSLL